MLRRHRGGRKLKLVLSHPLLLLVLMLLLLPQQLLPRLLLHQLLHLLFSV